MPTRWSWLNVSEDIAKADLIRLMNQRMTRLEQVLGGVGGIAGAVNANTGGVGVFDALAGSTLNFRGIDGGSSKITAALDAGTKRILLDAVPSSILDGIGSTRGAILYRGASAWALRTPGTAGDVLTSQGAGADPIYQAPAGDVVAKTGSDQALTGITLADVTGMGFSVAANGVYLFDFWVPFQTATATVGMQLAVTCPASPSLISYVAFIANLTDGGNAQWQGYGTSSGDAIVGQNVPATGTSFLAHLYGVLANGANAGTLQLQAANETASNNITVKAPAIMKYRSI